MQVRNNNVWSCLQLHHSWVFTSSYLSLQSFQHLAPGQRKIDCQKVIKQLLVNFWSKNVWHTREMSSSALFSLTSAMVLSRATIDTELVKPEENLTQPPNVQRSTYKLHSSSFSFKDPTKPACSKPSSQVIQVPKVYPASSSNKKARYSPGPRFDDELFPPHRRVHERQLAFLVSSPQLFPLSVYLCSHSRAYHVLDHLSLMQAVVRDRNTLEDENITNNTLLNVSGEYHSDISSRKDLSSKPRPSSSELLGGEQDLSVHP